MKQKAIPAEVCKKNLNVATVLLTLGKIDGAYEKVCGSMSQGQYDLKEIVRHLNDLATK